MPSSLRPSWSNTNFVSATRQCCTASMPDHLLPGVMNPDTVHSLNRSTDLRYLPRQPRAIPSHRHLHRIVFPHHVLDYIQAGICYHLDHMPVLPTPHPYTAPACMVRCARRPRQRRQRPGKRGRRPRRQVRRQGRCHTRCWLRRVMREAVERCVRRREDKQVMGHPTRPVGVRSAGYPSRENTAKQYKCGCSPSASCLRYSARRYRALYSHSTDKHGVADYTLCPTAPGFSRQISITCSAG